MTVHEMDKLMAHFDRYFKQNDAKVLHMTVEMDPHVDILVYPPNEVYRFWKLVTMGASDYKMPSGGNLIESRNEYMLFVSPEKDLNDPNVMAFYHRSLMGIAYYPVDAACAVTYGHSFEWEKDEDSDMVGAFLEFPQVIEDVNLLRCKLGMFKKTACLQAVLLTRAEIDRLLDIGPQKFSEWLYPDDPNEKRHFLSEQWRSEAF